MPPTIKRIVCLANSRKLSGRCIAGRELVDGGVAGWVRPISARELEEVSERERTYENGEDPIVLDVIDVPLLEPRPTAYQTENWLLDPDYYWTRVGRQDARDLRDYVDNVGPLWLNGGSTIAGLNDRIPVDVANGLTSSLTSVRVPSLHISVFSPGAAFGNPKRRVQARFAHGEDDYELGPSYLTLSLGEPSGDTPTSW